NSAEQEAESADTGQTIWSHHATYSFKTVDGRLVRGSESSTGMLRPEFVDFQESVPVVVEYLPSQPTVNRLRGGDRISLASLAIRVLLALAFIGVWLWFVYHSILQFRKDQATHGDPCNAA